jgi:hypothetical protein
MYDTTLYQMYDISCQAKIAVTKIIMSNHSLFADMDATASNACVGLIEE